MFELSVDAWLNLSAWKVEARSEVKGQPQLRSKCEASLVGLETLFQKEKNKLLIFGGVWFSFPFVYSIHLQLRGLVSSRLLLGVSRFQFRRFGPFCT